MIFQMGWRNIWRNKRRTAVILTAVVIGVWSMIFLGALMRGMSDRMRQNGIATLIGHIQVHIAVVEFALAQHAAQLFPGR